jgi:hypothetical protein
MPRNFWAENKPTFIYAHKIALKPYMTAYGPDTRNVNATPGRVPPGAAIEVTATVADHRYGGDQLRPVYAAEYFIDAPGADGTGNPMSPADLTWGDLSEDVTAVVDTSSLPLGRHYILVHGQNDRGDWGPFTAVFLDIDDTPDPVPDIKANGEDGPLSVTPADTVSFTVSLDPGGWETLLCDWWFFIVREPGTVVYRRYIQRPLFDLAETEVVSGQLPEGVYQAHFVIDDVPDGAFDTTWYDSVAVESQGSVGQTENDLMTDETFTENTEGLFGR